MEHFCVITNSSKDPEYKKSKEIYEYLRKRGKSCVITTDYVEHFEGTQAYTDVTEIPGETECAIVLGGDGTFIQAAVDIRGRIPLLGVNMGTLGFLTEAEQTGISQTLDRLIADDCRIEERMMLKGAYLNQHAEYALNDIVITKSGSCRLVQLELFVNVELIETYVADGLIISTPTGSTGYNLSAGGPVMAPKVQAMVITPICPHSLNKRSMVVSGEDELVVRLSKGKEYRTDTAEVFFDGKSVADFVSGEQITICRAKETTKVVKMTQNSFFGILRDKLSVK